MPTSSACCEMEKEATKKELAQIAGYTYRRLYDIDLSLPQEKKLFVKGDGGKYDLAVFVQRWVNYNVANAWRAYREIERYLQKELRLELSPKSRVQKATAPVEFVGFLITPHGIRIRKKTTTHVKRSLKLIMALFASGKIGYDRAMESAICYLGMCKNVNGHNLARWIQENFFLQRNDAMCERERLPENGRHFYSIIDNGDGTADVYLRPDGETGCILVVQGVEQTEGLESDIRERFYGWCASGVPVNL